MSALVSSRRSIRYAGIAAVSVIALLALIMLQPPVQQSTRDSKSADHTTGGSSSISDDRDRSAKKVDAVTDEEPVATTTAPVNADTSGAGESDSLSAPGKAKQAMATGSIAPGTASPPAELGVKIIQNATIQLMVKKGRIDEQSAEITLIASSMGGYVVSSSLSGRSNGNHSTGTITIRVPGKKFGAAVKDLRALGTVRSMDVSSEDVTQEFVDVKSRLRHDRAVESRLLALLARTKTVSEALAVQAQLDTVQEQIEVSQGRLNYLDQLTELSTITIALREKGAARQHHTSGGVEWGMRDAFTTGAQRFVTRINNGIISLGGSLPVLLLIGGASLIGRSYWRKRRSRKSLDS